MPSGDLIVKTIKGAFTYLAVQQAYLCINAETANSARARATEGSLYCIPPYVINFLQSGDVVNLVAAAASALAAARGVIQNCLQDQDRERKKASALFFIAGSALLLGSQLFVGKAYDPISTGVSEGILALGCMSTSSNDRKFQRRMAPAIAAGYGFLAYDAKNALLYWTQIVAVWLSLKNLLTQEFRKQTAALTTSENVPKSGSNPRSSRGAAIKRHAFSGACAALQRFPSPNRPPRFCRLCPADAKQSWRAWPPSARPHQPG